MQNGLPRTRNVFWSTVAGAVVLALLLATAPTLPMAWDEGNALGRAASITDWGAEVRERGIAAFSRDEIARHWHYTVEIEGHPALYGVAIAVGQRLAGPWLPPLTAARFGPMLLSALAAGAMFYRLRREYSLTAAVGALAALMTMPRVFAHAHFASFDGPLTSCWILAWAMFPTDGCSCSASSPQPSRGVGGNGRPKRAFPKEWTRLFAPRWRCGLLWGVAIGAAMSCKFTGWLTPLPFVAYALVYGDRKTVRTIAIGFLTALATFWLLNPRLWHQPIDGMRTFFDLNLGRAGTAYDFPTLFFGSRYNQTSGLPWYNTLVWTGVTVPVGTLLFAAIGIIGAVRRWAAEGQGVLLVLNWLTLIVVRALPGAPVHDAERLILPSFAFLAALAGLGCHFIVNWKGPSRSGRRVILSGIVAIYVGSASSLVWYAPQWLSYYNLLIGGLRGADAAGMEATYYWDALDNEVLAWLHEHTAPDEKIEFSAGSTMNLELMEQWSILKRGWRPGDAGVYRWRVIQRRPTFWTDRDRRLVENETPAFKKTIRPPSWGVGPWRLDVPLIEIFPLE